MRLGISTNEPRLLAAQAEVLARQIPLLYSILLVNAVIAAPALIDQAPLTLTIAAPVLLSIVCVVRGLIWFKRMNAPAQSIEMTARYLRVTTMLTVLIAVVFVTWALTLFEYADEAGRLHLAFYIAVTALTCAVCLMHLPFAAITLTFVVLVPVVIVFISTGQRAFISIACNLTIVDIAFVVVLYKYFQHFKTMVHVQINMQHQSFEIARLHTKTREIEAQKQVDRQEDIDRIAVTFTHSIEGVTCALAEAVSSNALQSREVATSSDLAMNRLEKVTEAAGVAEGALTSVVAATVSLFDAIDAIKIRTEQSWAVSTKLEARTGSTDHAMKTLDGAVGQIGSIANVIKSIANQINLIALNATIEAARAGDAGRGFAVVATEIKVLALQTANAIDDIGRQIANVKAAAKAANASVVTMKDSFLELRAAGEDIAAALDMQSMATDDIRGSVSKAVDGASFMRKNLSNMTSSTFSTNISARGMLTQCDVLRTETDILAREVKNFVLFIKAA